MVFALALGNLSLCAALFFYEFEQRQQNKSLALSTWAIARQLQAGIVLVNVAMAFKRQSCVSVGTLSTSCIKNPHPMVNTGKAASVRS